MFTFFDPQGHKKKREEGEKPFWISYADLMTALMMLFLVVMAVSLIMMTRKLSEAEQRKVEREQELQIVMSKILETQKKFPQVNIDPKSGQIDFKDFVRFNRGDYHLSTEGARLLRAYVKTILSLYEEPISKKWVKRVVVEGFTDQDGSYLYNLELSLARSQSVICALFAPQYSDEVPLSLADKKQILQLFVVGGFSFNSAKATKEESRRVELRLEFRRLDEPMSKPPVLPEPVNFGQCSMR